MVQSLNRKLSRSAAHVHFTVATGRALAGIAPLLSQLHLRPNVPIAAYNGGLVVLPRTWPPLCHQTIPRASFLRLVATAAAVALPTLAYSYSVVSDAETLVDSVAEHVFGWHIAGDWERELNGLPITRLAVSEVPPYLQPCAVLVDVSGSGESLRQHLRAELDGIPGISATQSSKSFVEVRPAGTNKGMAVSVIAAWLKLSREEVLAIGDNDNDAEMLAWAGVGVAVAGASVAALESSSHVCRHGVESGVVEVLRTVRQAKRFHRFLLGDSSAVAEGT